MLRFTHFLEVFGQKKCLFGSKTVFPGQEVHYYMVYIAYYTEINLQLHAITVHLLPKLQIRARRTFFYHFCPCRKAANFCHPDADTSQVISRLLMQAFNCKMQLTENRSFCSKKLYLTCVAFLRKQATVSIVGRVH